MKLRLPACSRTKLRRTPPIPAMNADKPKIKTLYFVTEMPSERDPVSLSRMLASTRPVRPVRRFTAMSANAMRNMKPK